MARTGNSVSTDDDDLDDELEDDELEDDEEDDEDDESDESPQGETEFDWDSDDNPWKTRFKGLQGGYQSEVERRQQLENERIMLEVQQFEAGLQQVEDPNQAAALRQLFEADMVSKYRLGQAQQIEQRLASAAKVMFIKEQIAQHDLDPKVFNRLNRLTTKQDIEQEVADLAADSKATTKKVAKAGRRNTTQRKFDSGGSGQKPPKKKATSWDEAANRLANRRMPRTS